MQTEIKITEDGSHTLFVPEIDECYHSTHGAIQESRHIFIEAGLKQSSKKELSVLEIGFGTGLNAFLTLLEAEKERKTIHFKCLELFPVTVDNISQLNYPQLLDVDKKTYFQDIHNCEWNKSAKISTRFDIEKTQVDFTHYVCSDFFDVCYFDAFSPEKQPEMWTEKSFKMLFDHANPNAVITTYCAKGSVRRAMKAAGFEVERLPGPPGKREMLRGRKT